MPENNSRQAGADFSPSMEAAYIGSKIIRDHIADPKFMAKGNWSGELAGRVFQAMVSCTVREGRFATLEVSERPRLRLRDICPKFSDGARHAQ